MVFLAQREYWLALAERSVAGHFSVEERSFLQRVILRVVGIFLTVGILWFASTAEAKPWSTKPAMQKTTVGAVQRTVSPPRVPAGFPACESTMQLERDLPRSVGETIRYVIDVDGVSVGKIDFQIARSGLVDGRSATEYRSLFHLDSLVSSVVPMKGQAATIVPQRGFSPIRSMNRYTLRKNRFEEDVSFTQASVASTRKKNGRQKDVKRRFAEPVHDFISGFYMMRSLPKKANGCTIIFSNQRAYTFWFEYSGVENVKTPVGMKRADRYNVRYANERSKKVLRGTIWIGEGDSRLPYRLSVNGKHRLDAHIHTYKMASR